MRILLVLALLGMTAACVAPPPPEAAAPPPAPVALVPTPVALVPAPPPPGATLPEMVPAVYVPNPLAWLLTGFAPAPMPLPAPLPGRVTLSNFSYDNARVEAVVTPYPDCQERAGIAISDFDIPLNGTRIIAALPGADVCWRRALPPGPTPTGVEIVSGWTQWSRVFTSSGRSIDSQL